MSNQQRPKTFRQTIIQPLAYTKEESLPELSAQMEKLDFGQEIEIRRAKDRPEITKSCKSGQPAWVTIATVALVKVQKSGPPKAPSS